METIFNYGALEEKFSDYENSKIVILPVAFDGTSTWIKGTDKGPIAIIEASANMELYDIETDSEVYKHGIFTDRDIAGDFSVGEMVSTVKECVDDYLAEDKFVVTIGGEHSVSIGAIRGHVDKYKDITVLQLDAHADLRNIYNGSEYNHACVMARAKDMCPIVQVGIRSMSSSEKEAMDKEKVVFAVDIHEGKNWTKKVLSQLSNNVYITIDLDVFDPSIMPSTGTPEPGGLFWYDVLDLLRQVIEKKNVVGFDVVELCPDKNNKSPDFLAAKLIYKLLSYKFGDVK